MNAYSVMEAPVPGYAAVYGDGVIENTLRLCDIALQKQNRAGTPLQGAVFALYGAGGETHIRTTASDADGMVRFYGLPIGEYRLEEKQAPEGYRLAPSAWYVSVVDPNTAADGTQPLLVTLSDMDGTALERPVIVNDALLEQPRTGGGGTARYTGAGAACLFLAGVAMKEYIRRKHRREL